MVGISGEILIPWPRVGATQLLVSPTKDMQVLVHMTYI